MNQNNGFSSNQQETSAPRFCGTCGASLSAQAAFCPKCGSAINPVNPPNAVNHNQPYIQKTPYPQAAQPPQQTGYTAPAPNAGYQNPNAKAKKCKTIGLFSFIVLAVIAAAVFYMLHISYIGMLAALALLIVLFVVQRLAAKTSVLATVLLVIAGVVFCSILLVAFLPSDTASVPAAAVQDDEDSDVIEGEEEIVVEPSDEDTFIDYGDFSIMIPGGTVSQDETLTVTEPAYVPEAFEDYEPLGPAIDVDLGDLKEFDTPIEIGFNYDQKKVKDFEIDAKEAFIAVYYNEETGYWDEVPYEVDEDAGVIYLIMHHLTTVRCYYSLWENSLVYDNGAAKVIYPTGGDYSTYYKTYEEKVGRTTGKNYLPQFVVDVADYAVKITQAYNKQGLPVLSYPKIYIAKDDNHYGTISGNVFLAAEVCDMDSPNINMACNLGHELFHATQCELLGIVDYSATAYAERFFWIEASAEYMGLTGFWEFTDQTPTVQYDQYQIDFFKISLTGSDQQHAYEAGNFLYYIQQLNKATPVEITSLPESYSAFAALFNPVYGNSTYPNLLAYYRQFLKASFDALGSGNGQMHFNYTMNNILKNDISSGEDLAFKLDDKENPIAGQEPIEGTGALTFAGAYTADFYKFTTNCDTTITITPDSDVMIYRFTWAGKDSLGYNLSMTAEAGQASELEFGKEDFIMITQASDTSGSLGFSYKAAPTENDITGRWNFTDMQYIDCEASAEFWSNMLEEFGYTKESYVAETNSAATAELPSLHLIINHPQENQYTVEFHMSDGYITMEDVQYDDGTLTAKGQHDGLWANITMTVAGDQMTGVMRSQIMLQIGESTWTATDVRSITLQHEAAEPADTGSD